MFLRLPSPVPKRPIVVDPYGLLTWMLFLHFFDVQKYSPLKLSQVHLCSTKLKAFPDVFPLPFTGGAGLAVVELEDAPRKSLSSATAAPHWATPASEAATPHWAGLDELGVEDVVASGVVANKIKDVRV